MAGRLFLDEIGAELVLPDGASLGRAASGPAAVVRVRDVATLLRLLVDAETGFADGYASGRIEIEGDLEALLERVYLADIRRYRAHRRIWLNPLDGSRPRARRSIHHHYDLGNEFYRLWLDQNMLYTCAYYPSRDATLEEAQVAKMDLVCRKLRLRAGEQVVEAGCGWGALAIHMASRYGVARAGVQHLARAVGLRARARQARGRERRRVRRGRLPRHHRVDTTRSCRWACSSTSARATIPSCRG